jgi:hypothetical protein
MGVQVIAPQKKQDNTVNDIAGGLQLYASFQGKSGTASMPTAPSIPSAPIDESEAMKRRANQYIYQGN